MRAYSTNTDLQASEEHFDATSDIIMTDILREQRRRAPKAAPIHTAASLVDLDLLGAVGRSTPPVKIYRVGPTGELVLKEEIQAVTFRRRMLETAGGRAFQERFAELQRKRRKAGQRSKAKSRAAKIRMSRARLDDEDDE